MRPMSRTKFHAFLGAALVALLSSACVVASPPPDSPAAQSGPGYSEEQPAEFAEPAPAPPAEQTETVYAEPAAPPPAPRRPAPERRPVADAPAYAPERPAPQAAPPPPPPPQQQQRPNRPNREPNPAVEYVVGRRARLGPIAEFSIEPTAGPVGTTVTIYGDFRSVRNPAQIGVSFNGSRRVVGPVYVTTDRIAVVVPQGARTGDVSVRLRNKVAWSGRFSVTPRDTDIFLPTPVDTGLLGAVYRLQPNTTRLPDFRSMSAPFATIVVPSLRVAPRSFDTGFPGLEDAGEPLLEWFGIRFIGMISVPSSGTYSFRVNSDDGAKLYIDDKLVVDNDGQHAPQHRDGSIDLAAGVHDIVVEYYQGPRYQIALELSWKNGNSWELVPPSAFTRYSSSGNDCSSEPQIFCCQSNSAECKSCRENSRRVLSQWKVRCQTPATPAPGPAPVDCSNEPNRFCCQGQTAQCKQCRQEAAAERTQWAQQCAGTAPGNPGNPGGPVVDCSRKPEQRMCCQGTTRQCRDCREKANAEQAQWTQLCGGQTPPTGPVVDCSREPQRMCCQAQTAGCNQCRDQAAAERAQWAQQCGGQAPGNPPGLDCSREPQRACCRGNTPQCRQCVRDAQDEVAHWKRLCGQSGTPSVDCSQRPQRACCKALTPQCRSCQDEASAELSRWEASCK
jgi:hypothetical protein